MDNGGQSGSLSENIWLGPRPTEVRRGFCFPKDISVMGKDLYNSLRLQKQSHLVSNTYVIFFYFVLSLVDMEVCYLNIVTFLNTLYVTINSNLQQKQTASSFAGCGKWKLKASKE